MNDDKLDELEKGMAEYVARHPDDPQTKLLRDEFDVWIEGYRLGWDEQTCVDRFQAFVAKPFDECGPEDVSRFEAALTEQAVNPNVRRHILERVERELWLSRWQPTALECPLCEGNGRIDVAQVRETGERIYRCIECDQCWDSPNTVTEN